MKTIASHHLSCSGIHLKVHSRIMQAIYVIPIAAMLVTTAAQAQADKPVEAGAPVAGLQPYARPANAPVIKEFTPPANFQAHAEHGIVPPAPPGLSFIKDQGAWYSPFFQPGMHGGYDIRGWHPQQTAAIDTKNNVPVKESTPPASQKQPEGGAK